MSEEGKKHEILQAIANRVSQKQPDEIRLIAAAEHEWTNPAGIEPYVTGLHALGFVDAGIYTVDVLPVAIRFLLKATDQMYAVIYEHPKAGIWINFVVLFADGTSITFTNTPERGMEQRPGHPVVHAQGASASQLYSIAVLQCPQIRRTALSADSIVTEFEKAWADGIQWRKSRGGISPMEVAGVILSRAGQPTRILRPERVHYIAEHDGTPERELKSAFSRIFKEYPAVEKAYLVYVKYDELPQGAVALCLVSTSRDIKIVEDVRSVFKALFTTGAHLDIMFVSAGEASRIEATCPPFFSRVNAP